MCESSETELTGETSLANDIIYVAVYNPFYTVQMETISIKLDILHWFIFAKDNNIITTVHNEISQLLSLYYFYSHLNVYCSVIKAIYTKKSSRSSKQHAAYTNSVCTFTQHTLQDLSNISQCGLRIKQNSLYQLMWTELGWNSKFLMKSFSTFRFYM